ncbi:MAG: diguanylate cyclase, partial [Chloroflexi bacterium]|nr:diguanylate cyclase [Chloroflexota bacterium]
MASPLAAVIGAVATVNHLEWRNQFEQRRAEVQRQYAHQVQGLLDQSGQRLRQYSTMVASLLSNQVASGKPDKGEIIAEFKRLAAILELDMGVEIIMLISSNGQPLATHGVDMNSDGQADLQEAARQVMATEKPTNLIDCLDTCLQYAIAPVLGTGDALILGISLADVVLDFQRISGTDLGVLVGKAKTNSTNSDSERWLHPWGAWVVALSNMPTNMNILRTVTHKGTLSGGIRESIYTTVDGSEYEIRLFPLAGFDQREEAYLVIIADISDAIANIHAALQRNISLGVTGLVLSELLLLAILWSPMSRLRRAAAYLPWLAEGAFSKVRAAIPEPRLAHFARDEVDVLDDTAIALSLQLEALNREVENQRRDLSKRMIEITQQRNFVTHIFETAQAIILTQGQNNKILTVNSYGLTITGYALSELRGQSFLALLAQEASIESAKNYLAELVNGEREHIEEECELHCKNHDTLNIVWHHSRLAGQAKDDLMILSVGMDITARKKAELRLAWLANYDPLTGLYNRRRFTEELNEVIAAAKRYHRTGALLFLDLDQFKYINDTSGHRAGDGLLQRLSELLPSILREVDVIGRLGGDEFGVILNQVTADEAIQVTRKIITHISEFEFSVDERIYKLSASIGIALFPEHGTNTEDLLAKADLAMYRVKESGRGGWHLLSREDQSQRLMRERVFWKQQVEHALRENRFLLYVQPILGIRDRTTSHYEVLLRMRGDDGEIIGPAQFIQVAERTGLIHSIDRMVMSETIRYQALAREQGLWVTFTMNLSAHAFKNPDLLNLLKQLLKETELDPR